MASWTNAGTVPWSSTRTPERLEQTADHCRALAGSAASVSAIKATPTKRMRDCAVREGCVTMLVTPLGEGKAHRGHARRRRSASLC